MTKERIYHLLHHFYNLLVNDFPRNGLITKGIYEIEQVYQALEAIPQSQAVSYTHLDVYKRQGLYYADFISFYSPTQLCGGGTTKSNSNELPISFPLPF